MRDSSLHKLEYPRVIDTLLTYAQTYLGRKLVSGLKPLSDRRTIALKLRETEETRRLIARGAQPPLPSLEGMEEVMALLGTGYIMSERQLGQLAQFARSCGQLGKFMRSKGGEASAVAAYASSMYDLSGLLSSIESCVDRGMVLDSASPELGKLRRLIRGAEEKLKRRLDDLLAKHADCLQERLVSQRGGRFVLPVKKENRKRIPGAVLDESASGQTVFVEPAEAAALQSELSELRSEESREEMQILARLTEEAENYSRELSVNLEAVGYYDLLLAKAKWALAIDGREVEVGEDGVIELRGARHPFLSGQAVPLHVEIGGDYRTLLITGPNTGGKTVAIKTVGLLTLMAQSGLLVPAEEGSRLSVFGAVEADIGDDQSLDRSLSTFSSHLRNVIGILSIAGRGALILLDELATGTDPGEGIGLSIAVLEELHRRGAVVLATTHFNEIKEYARRTPGFRNARMAFDEETLRPLYRLDMGEAGNSYAFVIARRLGIPEEIVDRAKAIAESLQLNRGSSPITADEIEEAAQVIPDGVRVQSGAEGADATEANADASQPAKPLAIGDVVWIPSLHSRGVVYRLPDDRGELIVQIPGEKVRMNRKRVKLAIESKQLYPDDYDMDIVFESVEDRKKRKLMGKRHVEGLKIEKPPER
ncbi:DNA mismatch repair protein MutS [Cohnella lubricantis]|uniref:DNA mismatch repair protein MutS n=1 Tax=Cohnella lubricantis TaxID=2163172 RepID=A0A841T763_9BACL|nr:DNA mismatch repair protein MutS [Cohnella lubricantis]MBB6675765.1 DNA mismatch repair protein MutS [Cohnella lubricantis]MBP2119840.1 dsDNA-specific endonuclease/ATPase MutS2 [Cohnella lubricantis]